MNCSFRTAVLISTLLFATVSASAATTSEIWEEHCAGCHGSDGKGQTRIGRKAGAKNLTDKEGQAKLTDADIFKLVKYGRTTAKGEEKMEAFGKRISDEQITALIQFVRAFAK